MKYIVELNGERHEVHLDGGFARIGEEAAPAHVADIPNTPVSQVTIGSEVHRVIARRGRGRGAYTIWVDGYRFEAEALDERTRAIRDISAAAAKPSGPAPVIAPMPGLIVRVNVAPGDSVTAGQGLVVMEAMKMENELRSPSTGIVRNVHAVVGEAVEKGTILVVITDSAATHTSE